jgi:hypothetical protein
MKIGWIGTKVHKICNNNSNNNNNNSRHKEVYKLMNCKKKGWKQNPHLVIFKPLELQVLTNRPRSIERQPFECGLGIK